MVFCVHFFLKLLFWWILTSDGRRPKRLVGKALFGNPNTRNIYTSLYKPYKQYINLIDWFERCLVEEHELNLDAADEGEPLLAKPPQLSSSLRPRERERERVIGVKGEGATFLESRLPQESYVRPRKGWRSKATYYNATYLGKSLWLMILMNRPFDRGFTQCLISISIQIYIPYNCIIVGLNEVRLTNRCV